MTEEIVVKRDIDTVTAEIKALCGIGQRVALQLAIEIGRRLVEAKELLSHGEWGPWLKESVSFSQSTATRYMKLFEEYGAPQESLFGAETNCAALQNLSVSNALRLLSIPEDEREDFAEEHDVEHLSSREMDKLMEDYIREQEACRAARQERDEVMEERDELREDLEAAERRAEEAEARARELEERPVEVAVEKPDPAEVQKRIDTAVKEAEIAFKAKQKELQTALTEAERKKKEAEAETERQKKTAADAEKKLLENQAGIESLEKKRLEREVEGLKKELAMADAAVASFRALFEQAQSVMSAMVSSLEKVTDSEAKQRLSAAVRKLLEVYGEKVAGDG